MKWWKILLIVLVCLVLGAASVYIYFNRPLLAASVDENNLPKFIQHDFIDLDKIASISKFRSGSGHDFSEHGESCRSMKHYFTPPFDPNGPQYGHGQTSFPSPDPATAISIMSPVDGKLTAMTEERTPIGKQLYLQPASNPAYVIRLFHVYPTDGIKAGMKVTAGQLLGSIGKNQGMDISVEANVLMSRQFVSYFQVMPDSIFTTYQQHGIASRDDLILTKAYRDSHPLQCTGDHNEEFATSYEADPNYDEEIYLTGYSRGSDPQYQQQQHIDPGTGLPIDPSPQNTMTGNQ